MEPKSKVSASDAVYLGIDVGGTKIQASLVTQAGTVRSRKRCPTPRDGGPEKVMEAITATAAETMAVKSVTRDQLTAVGIAIPGVVDPNCGSVVMTPNMSLTGIAVGPLLEEHFGAPVALGNDCNLGALGESWLGSARGTGSSIAILVGTGVGSGIVQHGRLWTGARESAGEIGHIVMQIGGPRCGCGNHGCLEALASRTAIERDIREALAAGRTTLLSDLLEGDLSLIRSGALRAALDANDPLVVEVLRKVAEVLGYGCLTVRHLVDPEMIVFGGGVIEACSAFMLPIIEDIVASDRLAGAREGGGVALSALGDDAVVLGAAALAATRAGLSPFDAKNVILPAYPRMGETVFGEIALEEKYYTNDLYIRVDGKVKKRKKGPVKQRHGTSHVVDVVELARICRGGPEVLFVGTGHQGQLALNPEAELYLKQRRVRVEALRTPELADAYNASPLRKAALVHVTC
ncbi:MAG: ROK family protein [Thermoguttaceae bacterium]